YRDVKADDIPQTIERVLKAYLANRASPQESFIEFARRHDIDALKAFAAEGGHEHHTSAANPVFFA
ncbi:MAG: hypothetical protein WCF86_07535, partial [Pseudolabrys sp.]